MANGTSASANTTPARFRATWAFISCSRAVASAPTLFGFGPGHAGVGLGLVGLEPGANVLSHLDPRNVDRHDPEGGLGIEARAQHRLGNPVGMFHHFEVAVGGADRRDDALAHPGDDRFLGRPADELFDVRSHRDPARTFNSTPFLAIALRVVRCDRLGSGQSMTLGYTLVCTASSTSRPARSMAAARSKSRSHARPMSGDDRADHVRHVSAGQVEGLQPPRGHAAVLFVDTDARLRGHDLRVHDRPFIDAAKAHADQAQQADAGA